MSMDILVHTEGFRLDDHLQAAVEEKVGRLDHFGMRILRARVTVRRTSAHASARQFSAHVLMEVPGRDLSAEQKAAEPLEAVDLVVEKVEQQLRKRKSAKLSRRVHSPSMAAVALSPA